MENQDKNQGCCPSVHAKNFEIILIIGFILSIILLTVNLILTLWCFKYSYTLFIIEIGLVALNFISIILSIILRVWRSDGSVHNQNSSSSSGVAIFNIFLVIINLLASIAEEVLFSFVISYLSIDPQILGAYETMEAMQNIFNNNMLNYNRELNPEEEIPEPELDLDLDEINFASSINFEKIKKKK